MQTARFPDKYPQSVDACTQAGHLLAAALSTSHPQFPHRSGAAIGCKSSRDPALPAGSLDVWRLGGAADQQVVPLESFV